MFAMAMLSGECRNIWPGTMQNNNVNQNTIERCFKTHHETKKSKCLESWNEYDAPADRIPVS